MLRESHREANVEEILKDIIGGITGAARKPPDWIIKPTKDKKKPDPEVPVTMWADWHVGEVVERDEMNGVNEFNMEIAEKRVQHLVRNDNPFMPGLSCWKFSGRCDKSNGRFRFRRHSPGIKSHRRRRSNPVMFTRYRLADRRDQSHGRSVQGGLYTVRGGQSRAEYR